MDVRFRKAVGHDLAALQALARETIDESYRQFIADEGVDWYLSGPLDEYLRRNLGHSIVAMVGDRFVGLAVCKDGLIDFLVIDHCLQRRGLGTALLGHCESVLFERHDLIRLESFEANAKANRFYMKNGWTRLRAVSDAMSGGRKWIFERSARSA